MSDEESTEPKTFDEAYVKKLRDESARYRTKLREYEAPFADFNDVERQYLFDIVSSLAENPREGAMKVRELAKNILQDDFFEGLDLPQTAQPEEAPTAEETETETPNMKPEDIQKMLDERDARARQEAEVEAIFREIEDAGFERGSEGFMTALSLAQTQASLGRDVDFKELAPKVHTILGTTAEPAAEEGEPAGEPEGADSVAAAAEAAAEQATAPAREFPRTAETGGTGGAGEAPKDWLAEAREKGVSPLQAARERAEARLSQ